MFGDTTIQGTGKASFTSHFSKCDLMSCIGCYCNLGAASHYCDLLDVDISAPG